MSKVVNNIIKYCFALIFLICTFFTLFHFERYPLGFVHSIWKTIIVAIIVFLVVWSFQKITNSFNDKVSRYIRIILFAFFVIIQFTLFLKIITPIGWDAGEVYYSAVYGISDWNYFSLHHNIIFPVLMMQNWLKVTEFASFLSPLRRMEILNLIFADASLILAFLTARKIFNKKMADIVLIFGIILIGFHPTLSVIYSDSGYTV